MTNSNSERKRGPGRPQIRDEHGLATEDRLLEAAAAACIENGFEGTTMADIARRVGIRVPSIYNYYPSKSALLVAAARRAFVGRFGTLADRQRSPSEIVSFMLSPELRDSRRLALELHSAASRHADIAELLDEWHHETARAIHPLADEPDADVRVKSVFVIILGLCHIDEFDSVPGSVERVRDQLATTATALLADAFPSLPSASASASTSASTSTSTSTPSTAG